MAKQLTLSELKAENASEENLNEEIVKDEYIEEETNKEEAEEESSEEELLVDVDSEDDDEDVELEAWQKSEDDVPEEDGKQKSGFVPNAGAAKLRRKLRDAKHESETKLTEMQAEIDRLKVSSQPGATEEVLPPRPKQEDFDYDDEKYNQALDDWYDKKTDHKLNSHTDHLQKKRLEEAQQEAAIQRTDNAVNSHLERAASLIADGKIKEDSWLKGDIAIREALESINPGYGDAIADQFITLLDGNGPGSEKAWYYVGQNPKALEELKNKVSLDKSGAQAVMYLAGIQSTASKPIRKKRSDAPNPSPKLKGDVVGKSAKSVKKQYDKSNDPGTRIHLKRKAKAAGVDVSEW